MNICNDHIVYNYQDVALSLALGIAGAGISTASITATFSLGFIHFIVRDTT
ncbi:hypothetical protein [Nostoc sp.]|uniref:hypothetical protein n=1 Tax=Nostoc sp. TaxID=1180 RepID=UPI002FFD4E7D